MIGKPGAGSTIKALALTDALDNVVHCQLLSSHRHDAIGIAPRVEGLEFDTFLADKRFNSCKIVQKSKTDR